MLLKQPKTIITLRYPFKVGDCEYVAMDYDGCHFTHKEFNKLIQSPYAVIISEDQYCAQLASEQQQYYYPELGQQTHQQQPYQYDFYDMSMMTPQ